MPSRFQLPVRLASGATLLLAALLQALPTAADELNIYSARQEALIKPLLDEYSSQTGTAGVHEAGSGGLLFSAGSATCIRTASGSSPSYGSFLEYTSHVKIPNAYTSDSLVLVVLPKRSSGAIQNWEKVCGDGMVS